MSLTLLLDENISHVIVSEIQRHRPEFPVVSIHHWQGGMYLSRRDEYLLRAAQEERLTLVTYDQNTIPPLFFEFVQRGENHGGVIFIDQRTMASNDFGAIVRSLIAYWDQHDNEDWMNRVTYLQRR